MTDLLQRYLTAIERRLPKATAKDIVAELNELLSAKVDAKSAQLGREANADEVAEILREFGHPAVVASRYSGHDYLIGPNYYPWFWHVQRVAVGLALAIGFGIVGVRALGSEEPIGAAMRGFGGAIQIALITFGVVTALFIAAERNRLDMKWSQKWNPRHLPRDNVREPKPLFESGIALFFDILFVLFWTRVVRFPNEMPVKDGGEVGVHFAPVWDTVYWPILALVIAATLVHAWDLVHPAWTRLRSWVRIAGHVAGLAILWILLRTTPLISIVPGPDVNPEEAERLFQLVDGIVHLSLGVAGLLWAVAIGVEVWRQVKASRPPSPGTFAFA
jgi:hypothetical protein